MLYPVYFRYNNTISGAYQPPHPQQSAPLYQPQYNQMHLSIFPLQTPGLVQVIILFPASQSTSGLQPGHVGPPLPCNMVKLADVAHMEYFTSGGQGEVCIRGLNVFQGYFRDEERSAASLDTGGWLHTGDIGEWTSWGTLRIIDKTKTIFKLANGDYVDPDRSVVITII